MNWHWLRNFGS